MAADDLYDRDFYLWTKAQAEALRARGRGGNAIDYDVLAEEVEDLGISQRNEALSRVSTIIEHLFKLALSANDEPKPGWRTTIRTQRRDLKRVLTGSIRNLVQAELETLHEDVARDTEKLFADVEPTVTFDPALRWTFAQILGEQDDPVG